MAIRGPKGAVVIRFDPEALTCRLHTDTYRNHSAVEETVHILDFEWNYLCPGMAASFTATVLPE